MKPGHKFFFVFSVAFLFIGVSLGAAEPATVALSDFTVNSGNPAYSFLGKGFAEIVSFELKKSSGLRLIDRERRNKLLEEMEFSLSGAADPKTQVEMGKLLSVRYLVSGSITDMAGTLLISLSMVDVESGEIVWNDQLTETGGKYAYIGAYFGKSLLSHFKVQVSKSTEVALAAKTEKDAASVVALSQGIAALDDGKTGEAKQKLAEAKRIDPANAVAVAFLDLLASASAKFKVVPERYVSYYNPAFLGGMGKDRLHVNVSQAYVPYGDRNEEGGGNFMDAWVTPNASKEYQTLENGRGTLVGYAYPITERFGIGIESRTISMQDSLNRDMYFPGPPSPDYKKASNNMDDFLTVALSAGFAFSPSFSLGAGVYLTHKNRRYFNEWDGTNLYHNETIDAFGGEVGAALQNSDGTFVYDILAAYGTEKLFWYDTAAQLFVSYGLPLYVEHTLTGALNGKTTFIALKQSNDIYLDRNLYYGRVTPTVEQWFFGFLALRAGGEGSVVLRNGSSIFGWGATGGLSVKVWRITVDANYTFRMRPSRALDAVIVPESVMFITVSLNGLLKS